MNDNINKTAFSLAEALITLLFLSIILAAMAPLMTNRMKLSQASFSSLVKPKTYKAIFDDSKKNGTNENIFEVPQGLKNVFVTTIGGGGSGGNAMIGSEEFKGNHESWTVPEGVTKMRVYMIGGGGSGASGGVGVGTEYGSGVYREWLLPGEYTLNLNNVDSEKGQYKMPSPLPSLPINCQKVGSQWEINIDAIKILSQSVIVTACGGGGGAGGSSSGATGGRGGRGQGCTWTLVMPTLSNPVYVGGGGGAGGSYSPSIPPKVGGLGGGGGGESYHGRGLQPVAPYAGLGGGYCSNGACGTYSGGKSAGVGGSTGCTAGRNASNTLLGGGGGGGADWSGGGGGGGATAVLNNYCSGGGGGGGASANYVSGGGGAGAGKTVLVGGNSLCGSGASAGQDGTLDASSNSFCSSYGVGGTTNTSSGAVSGQNGALRLTWGSTTNSLKCSYSLPAMGSGGGGGGQVWVGEIDVPSDRKLSFYVGPGGLGQTNYGANGHFGSQTKITNSSGSTLAYANGGGAGKYTTDSSQINNTYGVGGGKNTTNWSDWTGLNIQGGANGVNGTIDSGDLGGTGGTGGRTYFKDGTQMNGGIGGGASSNGSAPTGIVYGSGGGGGGGASKGSTAGTGAAGANGYIYIEWGGSNAGGGSSGQVTDRKPIANLKHRERIEITVGQGGINSTDKSLGKGADSKFGLYSTALGGSRGEDGGMVAGIHGKGGLSVGEGSLVGTDGLANTGGLGGNAVYALATVNEGLGGCGGNVTTEMCNGFTEASPQGKSGAVPGAGGGGGAMKDGTAYKGGNGADGIVIIEWE